MKENRLARWRDRRIFCGKPPYEYVWNGKENLIEIEPEQGELYQRIVKECLDLGKSLNDISLELDSEGIPTRNDGSSRWSIGTLFKILKCSEICVFVGFAGPGCSPIMKLAAQTVLAPGITPATGTRLVQRSYR